jgi:hypothetical protein
MPRIAVGWLVSAPLPPDQHRLDSAHHPTPFSTDQIREACAPGRRNVYRVTAAGAEPYLDTWTFDGGDAIRGEMTHLRTGIDGMPRSEVERSRATWDELRAHASYPLATTSLSASTVTTTAGTFEGWLYETVDGESVTRAWFARGLPGPPVLIVTERAGVEVFRYELMAVADPRSGAAH